MIDIEQEIQKFINANKKVDWLYIKHKYGSMYFTESSCDSMLELCNRYGVEFPTIVSHKVACTNPDVIGVTYGYLRMHTFDVFSMYGSNNNEYTREQIEYCEQKCGQYGKLLRMTPETFCTFMERMMFPSETINVTTTGEDIIPSLSLDEDITEPPKSDEP